MIPMRNVTFWDSPVLGNFLPSSFLPGFLPFWPGSLLDVLDDDSELDPFEATELDDEDSELDELDATELDDEDSELDELDAAELDDEDSELDELDAAELDDEDSELDELDASELDDEDSELDWLDASSLVPTKITSSTGWTVVSRFTSFSEPATKPSLPSRYS